VKVDPVFSVVVVWVLALANASAANPRLSNEGAMLHGFEGHWGFVSSEPSDSLWGSGLRGGVGRCGGPKALNVVIRREALENGSEAWMLRMQPYQPVGPVVIAMDIDGSSFTTKFFGDVVTYERRGDKLLMTEDGTRLEFRRCTLPR